MAGISGVGVSGTGVSGTGVPGMAAPPAAAAEPEPTIRERLSERPVFKLSRVREARPRDLGIRFAAGALTSVVAGVLGLVSGPKIGGIMLAFPAILAASLTLIEEQEDAVDAREDARGATAGGVGLLAFAICAWLLFGRLPAGLVLLCAGGAWTLVAGALYLLLWFRR